jgi:hypothetical protein
MALLREAITRNKEMGNYRYAGDRLTEMVMAAAGKAPDTYLAALQAEIEECDRAGRKRVINSQITAPCNAQCLLIGDRRHVGPGSSSLLGAFIAVTLLGQQGCCLSFMRRQRCLHMQVATTALSPRASTCQTGQQL